ncbi:Alkaline phosphatase synthesis transcriptional regulatory protein PhoP [Oceanobacillus picturae]|jgi:two-component system, OmpR family, alkaline phosphatase synthesis response regulator PhoP|uniref:Alkaline phosphatase synthesis transcriptional regulatory protein PhoP n=2 Tax=Oceanobacillus TaxID=182709 RepID=W9AG51_9BACI|nr:MULTISPECIES: response regulator transcription factor [Oceanobacillus]AVQ99603.1 DNA-binding response regulator [Oceanobacillus iheyensis]MCG3420146.1 response regulator transcription factor [Oceanobacillus jordanicus]NAP01492.1 response regulator [Halomonas sp. MG34]CDO01656.1 Alkaline phosphatase synthesis transcriptional regulatory protein PhoP [Oceanobacillus picturae]
MKQNILIVDDEKSIVTLLNFNIEKAGFQTDVAYDGAEAIKKAEANDYDLIILDLMLPEMDGMEVCKYLRNNKIDTPILMLTAKDEEFDKVLGLELGADDYLTKPFSPKEVIARMKAILRRSNKVSKSTYSSLKIGELIVYPERYEAEIADRVITFTRKEFELLHYLANNKGKVISRDQLLSGVWDYDFVGDTRIVDVHVSHLRDKIEPDTKKPKYIKTVRGLGYKLEEPTT